MLTKQELYQTAMRTVCARRQVAKANAQDARRLAEAAVPGLAEAENAFRQCGIHATLAAASGGDSAQALAELSAAKQRCNALLRQSGRPADCLAPKYTCPICEDTGMKDGRPCTCVQALMRKLRRAEIEKASSLSISRFDTMELRYYPEARDAVTGCNIRSHMQTTLGELREYALDFDRNSVNLLLIGNAGLGKTHAALSIAGIVLDKGYDVIYMSSPEFFSQLETAHFDNTRSGDEEALMTAASEADLLILDDLGTEMVSSYMLSTFYTLLNNRMSARRPTIFTSNIMDGTLLEKRYTEKIASRLAGGCEQFVFLGSDIRQQKAQEN
jgi:DNA replication protein DnaC